MNISQPTSFLNPERVVSYLEVIKGMHVADFGAGAGFYTLPLARRVGEEGKVFAFDVQKRALDLVKSRARLEHLLNVETVWADLELSEGTHLPAESVNLVVISNILFQVEKKFEVLMEAHRILKIGARVAVIEWDETPFPGGPPSDMRLNKRAVQSFLSRAGFSYDREFEAGSHHYGLLYKK
ncbi:MAG: methyltransferase domain-containing protein [Candidatus Sungbacteria bacterium]|nr:methyltransferase domain-containing protein [Candidatus Sungbacteria bacterium]